MTTRRAACSCGQLHLTVEGNALKIVLRWAIQQADLHIHHNDCIHGLFPGSTQTGFNN